MTKQDFIDRAYLALVAGGNYDLYHDHADMWEMAEWMYEHRPQTAKMKNIKRTKFVKPTPQEVNDYMKELNYSGFTGEAFVNFYESKGWKIGSTPMKSWKAAVKTWYAKYKEKHLEESKPARRGRI